MTRLPDSASAKRNESTAPREWVVKFNGGRVQITNGLLEMRDWGSYRHEYPKNERQLRKGLEKARKVVAERHAADARARALRAFADREGLI